MYITTHLFAEALDRDAATKPLEDARLSIRPRLVL